jgi:YidC/Oxa1 family membrane protein insertase
MYDRKTWIVVSICSVLLAGNIYYQQKNAAELAAKQKATTEQAPPKEVPKLDASVPAAAINAPKDEQTYTLLTPEAKFTLTNAGGGVKSVELLNAPKEPTGPVVLNQLANSPIGSLMEELDRPEAANYNYVASESEEGKKIVFRGQLASGLIATKTWSLVPADKPGAPYQLAFQVSLQNPTEAAKPLKNISVFLGASGALSAAENLQQTCYLVYHEGNLEQISSSSFSPSFFGLKAGRDLSVTPSEPSKALGYAGVSSQFFVSVLKPTETTSGQVWGKVSPMPAGPVREKHESATSIRAGLNLPDVSLAPKETRSFGYTLYTGPKENNLLRKMGSDWGELMTYGMFSPVSRFMNWSLHWVHAAISKVSDKWSWGLSVVVLTLLLRLCIWPIYNKSNRAMKRMSKLKPHMDKIREKYSDDPNKMNTEMMKLYKTYGVNPLGGCLPMLIQMPIFFGFYAMLSHAVELRGASFLWVNDLSQPDTLGHLFGYSINLLPILMAITSFAQMAMMPSTGGDKTQAMMMRLMPFMFLFICYNFASALALYWTTSNLFSILQTFISNRLPEPELVAAKNGGGKSFMERMVEKQQNMEKMRQAQGRVVSSDGKSEDPDKKKKRTPRTGG